MGHRLQVSFAGVPGISVPPKLRCSSPRILCALLAAAAVLIVTRAAQAESVSQLHYSNYVNDFAHVINDRTENELNALCLQLDQKAHAQVAVVTINSLDGSDIESYSFALAKQWGVGVGSKSTNRGVLILLAVKDHKYRFEVSYGLESILPDGKVGGFGREAVPLLKRGDYSGAVGLMTDRVANTIAQDAGVQLVGNRPPVQDEPSKNISGAAIFWIILVLIFVLVGPLRKVLFWWLLFNGGPRLGGGTRRGGWGNFGGFGGGGFGGGFGGGGGGGFGGFGGGGGGGFGGGGGGGFGGFGGGGGGGFGGGGASGGW